MSVKSRAQLIVWCLPHLGFVETESRIEPTVGANSAAQAANTIPAGNATVAGPTIIAGNGIGTNRGGGTDAGAMGM